ncbi:MAG TPA: MurR/RpiR family transcriptional regulator [Firmicutes bacterium]|nr:MurR/RpiR family transcriptional regulator [Bacillota bacterium]
MLDKLKEQMSQVIDQLSERQLLVAQYLLNNHLPEVATCTAAQIGRKAGVSEATVIRFAISAGFKGYADLQDQVRESLTQGFLVTKLKESLERKEDQETLLTSCLKRQKDLLDCTFASINAKDFKQAIDLILSAHHIITVGFRSSASVSWYLGNCLQMMLGNASMLFMSAGFYHEQLYHLEPKDLLIAISFSRYTKATQEVTELGKKHGANIIAITDSPVSPIAQLADVALLVPADFSSFQISTLGAMAVAEALLTTVAQKIPEQAEQRLRTFEANIAKYVF